MVRANSSEIDHIRNPGLRPFGPENAPPERCPSGPHPVKRKKTLDAAKAAALAEAILEEGQKTPISIREDGDGFVLVEGLHRLEACRALGRRRSWGRWSGRS